MWRSIFPVLLLSCGDAGFDGVSIRPTYGWADGCTDVTVTGRGFDEGVGGAIDGAPLTGIAFPDPNEFPLDVGFKFTAVTPPGEVGFSDLEVINGDGESATVKNAFYYVACPGSPNVDYASTDAAASGDTVSLVGCGFSAGMTVELVSPDDIATTLASVPLELACSTAIASFAAPDLPVGTYVMLVTDGAGTVLYGAELCDSADTGYYYCDLPLYLTYGGGS